MKLKTAETVFLHSFRCYFVLSAENPMKNAGKA